MKKIAFLITTIVASSAMAQLPKWTVTDKELTQQCNDGIAKMKKDVDAIATSKSEPSFENTVVALDAALASYDMNAGVITFLEDVGTKPELRAAAGECKGNFAKAAIDVFSRDDLFIRFQTVRNSTKGRKLQGEDAKLLNDFYSSFIESGVSVADKAQRAKIQDLGKQIADLQIEFMKNLREDKRFVQLDKSEMAGLPGEWVAHLEKAKNGKYIVTTQYPDYNPFMQNAKSENARKRLYEQFNIRGGKRNLELFQKTLQLRDELAQALGFANHADKIFALQGRMATSTKQVYGFLGDLAEKLVPYRDRDLNDMRKLKCKETRCKDWDKITINPWDVGYYINQMEKSVGVDKEKIREYFPMETVTRGMFDIYQTIFNVNFEKQQNIDVWDPSVEVYAVRDKVSHELLGTFYLDLYPRDGKYGHAAMIGLIKPRYLGNGQYQKPVAAMMCNFTKSTADAPSLLQHDEVETYFHEFGHIMDGMLSRTKYYNHGGETTVPTVYSTRSGAPRDFVEAPSQMLENWVWNPTSLALLSGHYKTGEKLPKDMLDKMIKLKNVANGYVNTRQLFLATIDLDYHTAKQPVDANKMWNDKTREMNKIVPLESVYPIASFGHLMNGYDVGYYGYMWSKVYAEDMFSLFDKNGIMDARTGMRYRKMVYEPSGSQSTFTSVKNFLGREPNQDAFLKSIGIEVVSESKAAK